MKTIHRISRLSRRLLAGLWMVCAALTAHAESYVTDIMVLGAESGGSAFTVKNSYREWGWTVPENDLNNGASGWWVYIAYKTSSTADPETGYITDVFASNVWMNSYVFEGRTYYRAGSNAGFDGDLNKGADGDFIYLYYTRDRANLHSYGSTKRVITQFSITGVEEDGLSSTCAVLWRACGYGGAADMNKNAGGDFIYIQQYFATQTLTVNNHPVAAENIVYDGTQQFLVAGNPTGNYGTMKYRIGSEGAFSSNLPRATQVGTYTVEYMLDGGSYANNSAVGSLQATIQPPMFKAASFDATFNQADQAVYLTWSAGAAPGNYTDYQWVLYRGNTQIATLSPSQRSYSDRGFRNEQEETYTLYYVSNAWNINTKNDEAAVSKSISCSRTMPVNNFEAEAYIDHIQLAWTSDGYPENFGHTFKIFVNDETEPIYTIVPGDYQTSYVWQHRTTSEHTERQSGVDALTGVPYTEEPLNGCQPRNYRVEGWIEDVKLSEVTAAKKSIGQGTLFVNFEAEKGVYPGVVKLAWQVNQQQETYTSKTYIVDRRLAEHPADAWTTIHRMSSADEYLLFTDETPQTGVYYDYRITVQDKCPDGTVLENEITDVGFAHTTGTVSGRITYGTTGTAVAGVDVVAFKSDNSGDANEQYHSMHFTNDRGAVQWQYPADNYQADLLSGDFSIQLWLYPEQLQESAFICLADNITFKLSADGAVSFIGGNAGGSDEYLFEGLTVQPETYSFLTFTRSGNTMTAYLINVDDNGSFTAGKAVQTLTRSLSPVSTQSAASGQFRLGYFKGYVDEFRLWTKCLSEEEVNENYDHLLIGNEKNLETYWTFDEGLKYQFFDYSRDGTFYHQHHGRVGSNAESSTLTPSALSLKAKTDIDGNYIIQGMPFAGEGATYSIVPTFGIHRFNPTQQLRYIGNNSLVHNSVDFDDVSSFRVRGVAYYEHTTIPVQEAYIYVDGSIASRDGEAVMTNDYGEFEVSVPIGDHFISIKKQGHTFINDGRYPVDPDGVGVRHTFDREISGLTFYDQTTVTVAGRVVGGDIENEKPLGLSVSVATIGQAKLELHLSNENGYLNAVTPDAGSTAVSYDMSSDTLRYQSTSGRVYVPGNKNYIVVETDPITGEWVAQLPPLRYDVTDVKIPSRPAEDMIGKGDFNLPSIDATHTTAIYADSVQDENGEWRTFEYMAGVKMLYKAPSVMQLTENKNGTFGMASYTVKDLSGAEHTVPLYVADEQGNPVTDAAGKVQYTFGYPVYEELSSYTYQLYAYERYTNYDGEQPVQYDVPLAGKSVTVKNQYASTTAVSVKTDTTELGELFETMDEELTLDDNGKALYRFTVGFPNILPPYTRGLSITYDNNGTKMSWSGNDSFKAIVLGGLPTGNNFVTQGPDEVLMVLRDPPGSSSSSAWKQGSSRTISKSTTSSFSDKTAIKTTWLLGAEVETGAGIGFMMISKMKADNNLKIGAEYFCERTSGTTTSHTLTASRDISTSSSSAYTGAWGDVFIGGSKNLLFGTSYCVNIDWDPLTGTPKLVKDTAIAIGEEFETFFTYDQFHIRKTLLPNYIMLRNNLLIQVSDPSAVARPAKGEDPIYVTTLSPEHPLYGTSNSDTIAWGAAAVPIDSMRDGRYVGPSYTMIMPMDYEKQEGIIYQDMVNFYNLQVHKWEIQLARNEKTKVNAIDNRSETIIDNYSLSAGASISESFTSSDSEGISERDVDGFNIVIGDEFGFYFGGFGVGVDVSTTNGGQWVDQTSESVSRTSTVAYNLVDGDYTDYLSIDVLRPDDGFGPVFVTRGGATKCPYEDQDTTVYYEPGTVISAKTMQVEKPEIEIQTPVVTGVPAGGTATIVLNLRNLSEVGYDISYDISVTSGSNPDGLSVMMDDASLNRGSSVYIFSKSTLVKTITVRQTNPDVLNYENIMLRLGSQCQGSSQTSRGEVADYASFSVYFQPACSDITLQSSHTLVNSDTDEPLTLSMSGYNYSMSSLKGIRLQYKAENDADFRTLQEYTKDESRIATDPTLLLLPALEGTAKLNYVLDLRSSDFADKTYIFRAVTVCEHGGKEVTNESEEVRVIRNLSRPQLIAMPSPESGVLTGEENLLVTFNEDIQSTVLTKPNNFDVMGVLNEGEVAHDVALNLSGDSVAKTNTTFNLDGKSFSVSMWLNYHADGTLLTHGATGHQFVLAVESGYLTVSVAGNRLTADAALPVGKWIYLHVSYNAANHVVAAGYAQDDFTMQLIDHLPTSAYEGNGALSLGGNGLEAQVQELVLWDTDRSMAEAQLTMYTTKSRYTHGLNGYWPFNEGHGTTASDLARSRHMTLPSANAWWVEGENYALVLDGAHAATLIIGAVNTSDEDDYLVEAWMKVDKTQQAEASLIATDRMSLQLNRQGYMQLVAGDNAPIEVLRQDVRDDQWHHLAINVLKSTNGSAVIYLDGKPCKQVAASYMPALRGNEMTFGQGLKGAVDEIRIWKARRTADVIKNARFDRLMGNEAGLVAYYPLEQFSRDEYNQVITTSTLGDLLSDNVIRAAGLTLSTLSTAPLRPAPKVENVQFTFVASERQIRIVLDEQPAKIEGCTVSLTAKRVKDLYGNEAQPVTWIVYVQQNVLTWQDDELTVDKTGTQAATFSAVIENRGSQSETWSISGMPEWLTANAEGGVLMPLSSGSLTFTVGESLPIGTYEAVVYLTGSQNIAAPLHITVVSEGEAPDWTAVPGESTMTVLGVINVDGIQSSDTRDMIAAFRGTECVGVAHPQYFSRYDSYMVLLTVYGGQQTASLTYKFYDASTGIVYPSVSVSNQQAYTFVSDRSIGTFANPVIFTPLNEIEQDLSHNAATWKWFSLYAQPKVNDVSVVFQDARDAIAVVTDGTNTLINWTGTLRSFAYSRMYKLQAVEPYEETLIGEPTDPTLIDITLNANGWTWMGYPVQAANSLDAALAEAEPLEGDMVKNQSGFSLYTEGEWLGTLQALTPGDGYMYYSHAAAAKTFRFPYSAAFGRNNAPAQLHVENTASPDAAGVFRNPYPDNMTMVAVVMDGETVVEEAKVGIYANGTCRAYSAQALPGGLHFITVGGVAGQKDNLTALVTLDGGRTVNVPMNLVFDADNHYGSVNEAVIIRIDGAQIIDPATGNLLPGNDPYKILKDGHLIIIRDGKIYNANGAQVR